MFQSGSHIKLMFETKLFQIKLWESHQTQKLWESLITGAGTVLR